MTQAARFTGLPGQKLGFQVAPGAWRRSGRKPGCRRRELSMQAAITSVSKPEVGIMHKQGVIFCVILLYYFVLIDMVGSA